MRELVLVGNRGVTLVDDADYDGIMATGRWSLRVQRTRFHTYRYAVQGALGLHRVIMDAPKGMVVDHINGDGLDNRRENLRVCTHAQNCANYRRHRSTTSRFLGVYWETVSQTWKVIVGSWVVGKFTDEVEAAHASDAARLKVYGEYASLNFPRETDAA